MSARSTASAVITFGLVSVPVKVYVSAEAKSISMKLLTPDGNLIRQKNFDAVTDQEVQYADLDKGSEHTKDEYVRFTKDELKALEGENTKTMDISEFVDLTELNPVGTEKSFYLGADKGGHRAYRLLAETLRGMGKAAIARWTSRGRDHVLAIRAHKEGNEIGLIAQQLFFQNEIRPFDEISGAKMDLSDAERAAAAHLVQALSSPKLDMSKYSDGYTQRVLDAVDRKLQGVAAPEIAVPAPKANVMDLLAALKASIKQ